MARKPTNLKETTVHSGSLFFVGTGGQLEEKNSQYWDGAENKAIRFYFYAKSGLAFLNEARYLIMGTFALYYTLRLSNPIFLVLIFFAAVPVLIGLGWLAVHRMGRVIDYLNIRFSTHYAKKQFDIFEGMLEELKKMNAADMRSHFGHFKNKKIKNAEPLYEVLK